MINILVCLVMTLQVPWRLPGELLLLDREMSGLFDSYLEAVPECPARGDTPVREWLLDLARFRASQALENALPLVRRTRDDDLRSALKHYLWTCKAYLEIYSEVRQDFRTPAVFDSSECVGTETRLFSIDSTWLDSGLSLFGLLAEEGWR